MRSFNFSRYSVPVLFAVALLAVACEVKAAPVTFDITPTFAPATGSITGYRAYQGCVLATQVKGALIAPVTSGTVFSLAGDTANTYKVCVVAYNATGEGTFATVGTITGTLALPGGVTTSYSCQLNPVSGGSCTVTP